MIILDTFVKRNEKIYDVASKIFLNKYAPQDFDDTCKEYMKIIDNAEFVDQNIGTVKTPFGITSYKNLSSGVRVAMFVHFLIKENKLDTPIFIGAAGENALELIFKEADNSGLRLLTNHNIVPNMIGYTFRINGKEHTIDGLKENLAVILMVEVAKHKELRED